MGRLPDGARKTRSREHSGKERPANEEAGAKTEEGNGLRIRKQVGATRPGRAPNFPHHLDHDFPAKNRARRQENGGTALPLRNRAYYFALSV